MIEKMLSLSVVIAAHNAASVIAQCLGALQSQSVPIDEIILADSSTDGTDEIVRADFPRVQLIHFNEPLTLPQLRGKGIALTHGDVIAILDPFSVADVDWAKELLAAHQARSNLVIGGVVDLYDASHQNLLTWAKYINEYGMFMPPMDEGEIEILPGSNVSYKRRALFADDKPRFVEFWKTFVNWEAETSLWLAPRMIVSLKKSIPFQDFLRTRFDHGRCFAGMRVANESMGKKILRAITSPILPAILLWRWSKQYWYKKRYRDKFLLTLPLQLLLFGYWAFGEFVGYVAGTGNSCRKLYY